MGLHPRFIKVLQSLYKGSYVTVYVNGWPTGKVWIRSGVKQGCPLSPLLFALFLSDIGLMLEKYPGGVHIFGVIISALLFVDDLALIGRTLASILKLIRICKHQFSLNGLEINCNKSKILSKDEALEELEHRYSRTLSDFGLQEKYKYLGVTVNLTKRSSIVFLNQRSNIVARLKALKGQTLIMARESFDPVAVGAILFTSMALLSVLYGIEVITLTAENSSALDSIQSQFASQLLNVNNTCAHIGILKEMGWVPVTHLIMKRKLKYFCRLQSLPDESWAKKAWYDSMSANSPTSGAWNSKYRKDLQQIFDKCEFPFDLEDKTTWKVMEKEFESFSHRDIASKIKSHRSHSLRYLPEYPISKYRQSYINGSEEASIITKFRLGHANLGNRTNPPILICPNCGKGPNNELHLAFECEALDHLRQEPGMLAVTEEAKDQQRFGIRDDRKLKSFLGNDFASDKTLRERGNYLSILRQKHLELMKET